MKVQLQATLEIEATSVEDALSRVSAHFGREARLIGSELPSELNGFEGWATGTITVQPV